MIKSIKVRNWVYSSNTGIVSPRDIREIFTSVYSDRDKAMKAKRVYSLSFIHGFKDREEAEFVGGCLVAEFNEYALHLEYQVDQSKEVKGTWAVFAKAQGTGQFFKGD